eukprot:6184785-Pleurochrysis_carterae.AAC.1
MHKRLYASQCRKYRQRRCQTTPNKLAPRRHGGTRAHYTTAWGVLAALAKACDGSSGSQLAG